MPGWPTHDPSAVKAVWSRAMAPRGRGSDAENNEASPTGKPSALRDAFPFSHNFVFIGARILRGLWAPGEDSEGPLWQVPSL